MDKREMTSIRGGEDSTCSADFANDATYVTVNTDQVYRGDGSDEGLVWMHDNG